MFIERKKSGGITTKIASVDNVFPILDWDFARPTTTNNNYIDWVADLELSQAEIICDIPSLARTSFLSTADYDLESPSDQLLYRTRQRQLGPYVDLKFWEYIGNRWELFANDYLQNIGQNRWQSILDPFFRGKIKYQQGQKIGLSATNFNPLVDYILVNIQWSGTESYIVTNPDYSTLKIN